MRNFEEYAVEQIMENYAKTLGSAFMGGLMQGARGQGFDAVKAITDPLQQGNTEEMPNTGQQPQQQPQGNDAFYNPKQFGQQWQKHLTGKEQKMQNLQQWFTNPKYNPAAIAQHYQGNVNQFRQDLQRVQQGWMQDEKQNINGWPAYVQQQLGLPQGAFG